MDPFQRLWEAVRDPREQMQLAVLYLVIERDLGGIVPDVRELIELMETRHRWPCHRTTERLDGLVDVGLAAREASLAGRPIYRLLAPP